MPIRTSAVIKGAASVVRAAEALIKRGVGQGLLSAKIAIGMADEVKSYALNDDPRAAPRLIEARDHLATARKLKPRRR